jgi:EmrB/QacA subfamily drug resistance transporter
MPDRVAQPQNRTEQKAQNGRVMAPLMLVLFISTLDQTIVVAALERIGAVLGNADLAPWVATAYLLTSAVTTLIFGKLGDMFGRKIVIQISIAIFVAGSVLCAVAPSMVWLVTFRAVQGIGGGGLNSLVMAIVADLVPGRERARYQAVLGIVPAIALIAGPFLGGVIVDHLRWPWIFLINVPLGLLALMAIGARLHLPRRRSPHRVDFAGGLLVLVFTTALLLVTVLGGKTFPWFSIGIGALGVIGLMAFVAYIVVERRAAEPITPLRLFADGVFSIASMLFFLATAVLFVGLLFVPLMLQTVFGLSASRAGACIVPLLVGLILATMVTGTTITRTGRYKRFPIVGALLGGMALAGLGHISLDTPIWLILALLVALGAAIGLFIQVTLLAGQNTVAPKDLGVATGALNFFKSLGGAVGAAGFGAILAAAMPLSPTLASAGTLAAFHTVFNGAIVLMVLTLLLAIVMEERPLSVEMLEIAEGHVDVPEY